MFLQRTDNGSSVAVAGLIGTHFPFHINGQKCPNQPEFTLYWWLY